MRLTHAGTANTLLEGLGSDGQHHKLLHGQLVPSVGASVYHVEGLKVRKEHFFLKEMMPYFSGSDVRMLASGLAVSYRNRKHQLCVSSQVSYVAVQRDVFLCRTGFADGERHSQDGVGSELSCRTGRQGFCVKLWVHCWFALINMNFYFNLQIVFVLVIIFKVFGVQLSLISL